MASDPATQVADDMTKGAERQAEKVADMVMREALREMRENRKKKSEQEIADPVPDNKDTPHDEERPDPHPDEERHDPLPDERNDHDPLPAGDSYFEEKNMNTYFSETTKDVMSVEEAREHISFDPDFPNTNKINEWSMATAPGEFAPDSYKGGGVILDDQSRENLKSAFMAEITEAENAGYARDYPLTAKMNVINSIDEHPDQIREELEFTGEIQGLTNEQSDFLRTMSHEENPAIADAAIEVYAKTIDFNDMQEVDKKFIEEQMSIGASTDHPLYTAREDLSRYYSTWENENDHNLGLDSRYNDRDDFDDHFMGGATQDSAVYNQVAAALANDEYDDLDLSIGSEKGLPRNVVSQMRENGEPIQSLAAAMDKEPGQYNQTIPDARGQDTHSVSIDRGGMEI